MRAASPADVSRSAPVEGGGRNCAELSAPTTTAKATGAARLNRENMIGGVTYHGGVFCEFLGWWYNMVRANNLHRAANAPTGKPMLPDLAWEFIRHQTYDDWWRERSP